MPDHQPFRPGFQGSLGRVGRRRVPALPRRLLLRCGVGRLVVHQVGACCQCCGLGRKVGVRQVSVRPRGVGTVGQFPVGDHLPRGERDVLAPLCGGDLCDRKPVFRNLELVDVQRRLLFAEKEPRRRHAVAQRYAPHLQRTVFHQQRMLGRVDLRPYDRVGQFAVEIFEVAGQNLAHRCRGEYPQRGLAAVERQRRDQREQPEYMVAVQVRDEHGT